MWCVLLRIPINEMIPNQRMRSMNPSFWHPGVHNTTENITRIILLNGKAGVSAPQCLIYS